MIDDPTQPIPYAKEPVDPFLGWFDHTYGLAEYSCGKGRCTYSELPATHRSLIFSSALNEWLEADKERRWRILND